MPPKDQNAKAIGTSLRKACEMAPESPSIDVSFAPAISTQLSLFGEPESISNVNAALLQSAIAVAEFYKSFHPQWRCGDKDAVIIVRALRELGYSAATLCDCIRGYHGSEWHRGDNDRCREYLYLSLLFRAKENIERGVKLAKRNTDIIAEWSKI